jgi:hypothetical protein
MTQLQTAAAQGQINNASTVEKPADGNVDFSQLMKSKSPSERDNSLAIQMNDNITPSPKKTKRTAERRD